MIGSFIISLDFELHWGGAEKWDLSERKDYFLNTRKVVSQLLKTFEEYEIRVTWATVGFLFAGDLEEIRSFFPSQRPGYKNEDLDYYKLFDNGLVGKNEIVDPFHFAKSLINEILRTKGQELSSHTFCHYYCNEEGQNKEQFALDLKATQAIADSNFDKKLISLVFPRNQVNPDYINAIKKNGYKVIRTNPDVWFWRTNNKFIPLARAADTLLSISHPLSFKSSAIKSNQGVILLPASRFLRPYSQRERLIQKIKIQRIKSEMLHAAKNNENYHLWWHPHNFGYFPDENMLQLSEILDYHKFLNTLYNFPSRCMGDFAI